MKVCELIKYLQECDPGAEVYLADWNEEYRDPVSLTTFGREKNPNGEVIVLDSQGPVEVFHPA